MSVAYKLLPHYTYDDYCQWEGRWELIEGIPYAMSPAPSMKHQWVNNNIGTEFNNALKRSMCKKCKAYFFIDYKIKDDTILQPDLSIICGATKKNFLDFAPALVVEILSPSTSLKDRNTKFLLYEEQGVKYYLIVDPETQQTEIYFLDENKKYKLQNQESNKPFQFYLDDDCGIDIELKNFWE